MVCQQPACEDFHYFFYQMHCSLTVLWGIFRFLTSSLTNFVQGLIFDNFWIFLGIKAWTCFFLSHILISRNYFPFYIPTPVPSPSLLPFPIHFLEELICQLVQMFNLIFWLKKMFFVLAYYLRLGSFFSVFSDPYNGFASRNFKDRWRSLKRASWFINFSGEKSERESGVLKEKCPTGLCNWTFSSQFGILLEEVLKNP